MSGQLASEKYPSATLVVFNMKVTHKGTLLSLSFSLFCIDFRQASLTSLIVHLTRHVSVTDTFNSHKGQKIWNNEDNSSHDPTLLWSFLLLLFLLRHT